MKKNETRKKVSKIYGQINKIALKGKDYTLEYHRLVDQIVDKGDYAYLEMCLSDFYNIDVAKYGSVYGVKAKTWKLVLEQTDSPFINKLRSLYKSKSIYQQGQEIRSDLSSYMSQYSSGPLLAEDITIKRDHSTEVTRTKYTPMPATMSQISFSGNGASASIEVSISDPGIYKIDIYKVLWATFSTPLYNLPTSMTQSQVLAGDLALVRMREMDQFGFKSGGIINTSAIRINDIYDTSTRAAFLGKEIGDRLEFSPFRIYKTDLETCRMLGIEDSQISSISNRFEAEILDIKRLQMSVFESPYEISRVHTIQPPGTQSSLAVGMSYSTRIPITHGGEYLVSTHRRGSDGWIYPELRYEAYSYRLTVRKDNLLGTIREVDSVINDPAYFQIKSRYAAYLGMKKTFLEVQKAGSTASITVIYENFGQSEEANLFARYKIAIDYLNS